MKVMAMYDDESETFHMKNLLSVLVKGGMAGK
jgi:hypothetical protein